MASELVAMASEVVVQLAMASDWWPWRVIGGHGKLHIAATHVIVVLGLWGRSGPFQTDSFDVNKCNQTF